MGTRPNILIIGGGYIGLYAALALERKLGVHEADISLVNPNNFMLYQPLLPEVASGTLEPRHAVVPLRKVLRRTELVLGRLTSLDHEARTATIQPPEGETREVPYDHVVLGLGSVSRVLPIPGLAEHAVGFKSIAEAIYLRNQVLSRMDLAEASDDPEMRRRALTFVFVGGGYTGVEALAELEDMARSATRYFRTIDPGDMRWVLVEMMDRIITTVDEPLSEYSLAQLRKRGVEVHLETKLESVDGTSLTLSNGEQLEAQTLVWSAGVEPHPLTGELGMPTNDKNLLVADGYLRVDGVDGAWTGGDSAAVPDLVKGGTCPPTAQYAEREGRHIGNNLAAAIRGEPLEPFRHEMIGEMITLGAKKGVAEIWGRHLTGVLPWLLRRGYYLTSVPSPSRKARILGDWLVGLPFRTDTVHLGPIRDAHESLTDEEPHRQSAV